MSIQVYFSRKESELLSSPLLISLDFHTEIIDSNCGYFKAKLIFSDNSKLFLFELSEIISATGKVFNEKIRIEKYRYHYQDANEKMIFRWDNAPHFSKLKSFPHHLHVGNKIEESIRPSLYKVIMQITKYIIENEK